MSDIITVKSFGFLVLQFLYNNLVQVNVACIQCDAVQDKKSQGLVHMSKYVNFCLSQNWQENQIKILENIQGRHQYQMSKCCTLLIKKNSFKSQNFIPMFCLAKYIKNTIILEILQQIFTLLCVDYLQLK